MSDTNVRRVLENCTIKVRKPDGTETVWADGPITVVFPQVAFDVLEGRPSSEVLALFEALKKDS